MNPAEEVVKFWLQEKGYFVQSSIKVGRKEIDILAVHALRPEDRKHIEVQVSSNSMATKPPEQEAQEYQEKKFDDPDIRQEIHKRFGGDLLYAKEVIKGEVRYRNQDCFELFAHECKKFDIEVIPFSKVLREVADGLGGGEQMNAVIKTVKLCHKFLCHGKQGSQVERHEKKCLCDDPTCAKCLGVNCTDENCTIHTKARKETYQRDKAR